MSTRMAQAAPIGSTKASVKLDRSESIAKAPHPTRTAVLEAKAMKMAWRMSLAHYITPGGREARRGTGGG